MKSIHCNIPEHFMPEPKMLGRISEVDATEIDPRASTTQVISVSIPFDGAVVGTVKVSAFVSDDAEDRGGVVLRLQATNDASAFFPHAVCIPNGIEVHLAGDIESDTILKALGAVIREVKR